MIDRVVVLGEERRHLALDRLDRIVGVRAGEIEEHAADLLVSGRPDSSPERRWCWRRSGASGIVRDGGDLGLLLGERRVEGGLVCSGAMLSKVEGRKACVHCVRRGLPAKAASEAVVMAPAS